MEQIIFFIVWTVTAIAITVGAAVNANKTNAAYRERREAKAAARAMKA